MKSLYKWVQHVNPTQSLRVSLGRLLVYESFGGFSAGSSLCYFAGHELATLQSISQRCDITRFD
jgi:hypothetical protein